MRRVERERLLASLREEAISDLRKSGCTCKPTMSLTEKVYGPHQLPMWQSEHTDDCALALRVGVDTALMAGSSITKRMR